MDRFVGGVSSLNQALHYVAGALLLLLMFMIAANIIGRTTLGLGVPGTVELTQLAMVGLVFFGMAYAQNRDDHISVDLLYLRLPSQAQRVLDTFASTLTLVVLLVIAWQLGEYRGVLEAGGRQTNTLGIPLHPVAWVAILGIVAYVLAVISTWIEAFGGGRSGHGTDGSDEARGDGGA